MKKLMICLPLAIAIGLSGCGNDTTDVIEQSEKTVTPISRVIFDPSAGRLSVPNDLLFLGTTDGTLEMPDEVAARAASGTPDYSVPSIALGALDGWSTQNPFVLGIDYPAGYSLDAGSAGAPGAIRLFEVKMGGDPGCESVPRGVACAPVAELTFGVDFVTSASGNSVAVAQLKPLKPATTYIIAITESLKDVNNGTGETRSIGGSTTYELVKQNIATHPLGSASQLALQGLVNSFEGVLAQGFAVDPSSLIYTAAMTTQSVGQILGTSKTLLAAGLSLNPAATPRITVDFSGQTVADKLVELDMMTDDNPSLEVFGAALLYQGNITLPYYLSVPKAENPLAPINTPWKAACDSGVMVQAYAAQAGEGYPYDAASTAPISANDGMCLALSGGALRDLSSNDASGFVLDKERHLTKFNTIPETRAMENLDVQMTLPDIDMVNVWRIDRGMETIEQPEAGWPVAILQHDISSRKEDMLLLTANLALAGFASVAIDLPLHASRGFDLNGDGGDEINARTRSATHFMNLGNLPVFRDNLRQGTADLLGLRLGLNFTQGAELDSSRVYSLGLSLGAMISTNFLAVTNNRTLDATLGQPGLDSLFHVNAAVLASAGGGIASLLFESETFSALLKAGVISAAGTARSDELNAFLAQPVDQCIPTLNNQEAYVVCQTQFYLDMLRDQGQTSKLAEIQSTIAQFVFATQSVIDAADPSNYASILAANATPLLITAVIGDGFENLSDQVVPNQTVNTPIGGTEPLVRALGLTAKAISSSTLGETVEGDPGPLSGVIRFTRGHHSSLINPAARPEAAEVEINQRVSAEMQSQVVSYFSADGTAVLITDDAFIQGANE